MASINRTAIYFLGIFEDHAPQTDVVDGHRNFFLITFRIDLIIVIEQHIALVEFEGRRLAYEFAAEVGQ